MEKKVEYKKLLDEIIKLSSKKMEHPSIDFDKLKSKIGEAINYKNKITIQ